MYCTLHEVKYDGVPFKYVDILSFLRPILWCFTVSTPELYAETERKLTVAAKNVKFRSNTTKVDASLLLALKVYAAVVLD